MLVHAAHHAVHCLQCRWLMHSHTFCRRGTSCCLRAQPSFATCATPATLQTTGILQIQRKGRGWMLLLTGEEPFSACCRDSLCRNGGLPLACWPVLCLAASAAAVVLQPVVNTLHIGCPKVGHRHRQGKRLLFCLCLHALPNRQQPEALHHPASQKSCCSL